MPQRMPQDGFVRNPARPSNPALQTDLAHLAETIAQATSVIQAAGLTAGKRLLFWFLLCPLGNL